MQRLAHRVRNGQHLLQLPLSACARRNIHPEERVKPRHELLVIGQQQPSSAVSKQVTHHLKGAHELPQALRQLVCRDAGCGLNELQRRAPLAAKPVLTARHRLDGRSTYAVTPPSAARGGVTACAAGACWLCSRLGCCGPSRGVHHR